MKKQTKTIITALVSAMLMTTGCDNGKTVITQSADTGQLDALKKENETLTAEAAKSRAELASLQSEIKAKSANTPAPVAAPAAEPKATDDQAAGNPATKKERFSYAVGLQIGGDFGGKEIEIDFDQFAEGVKTAYLSKDKLMTEEESKKSSMMCGKIISSGNRPSARPRRTSPRKLASIISPRTGRSPASR